MSALDRKLLRDIARLWAQVVAIALVVAAGVMTIVLAIGASRSLEETRLAFYERHRFADIFANATRAPNALADRIEALEGVLRVDTRIATNVIVDVTGMREPAAGRVYSLADDPDRGLNLLYVRQGRLPHPDRSGEVAVIESFAEAHGFEPGDHFEIVLDGRKRELEITAVILSPEHIYAIGPGDLVPDPRRYAVIYMPEKALEAALDMRGAFNDLSLSLGADARTEAVLEALDDLLRPYGGNGAIHRKDHTSHAFLDAELTQLAAMARVIPPIFLFVSAFLVNMVLSRLVSLERQQIGLMKAVGYTNSAIAWHYAKLTLAIAALGWVLGSLAGTWAGDGLTRLYGDFFSFPFLIFRRGTDIYLIAGCVAGLAALAGAVASLREIVSLPPAVAMRPAAPPVYGRLFDLNLPVAWASQLTIMALRHLVRFPLRSLLTMLGSSFSVALLVTALFTFDSVDALIETIYFRAERQDAVVSFSHERSDAAIQALARLPGVLAAEPFRARAAQVRFAQRERRIAVTGLPLDGSLSQVLDEQEYPMRLPSDGIVLSAHVARQLEVRTGERVEVEFLASGRPAIELTVAGIAQAYVGMNGYMTIAALNKALNEGNRIGGARLLLDSAERDRTYEAIKENPSIGSIALQTRARELFRQTIEENILIMTTVYVVLAVIITFGVIYNAARIQLSERARELASLCVFGFHRAEVSMVLLIELAVIVLVAQPVGWLLGYGFSRAVIAGFESDLYRIPFVVSPATFAWASLTVLTAAAVSALIVRQRVDRLDLIAVLKTRE